MRTSTKRILAAFVIAVVATMGTVTPADAANHKMSRIGDSWCC